MKKTLIALLVCGFGLMSVGSLSEGKHVIAVSEEKTPTKIAWVMDVYKEHKCDCIVCDCVMEWSRDVWESRVVMTYDIHTAEYSTYEIDKDWEPILSAAGEEGILFIASDMRAPGETRHNVLRWRNGNVKILAEYQYRPVYYNRPALPGYDEGLAYKNKWLFYRSNGYLQNELLAATNTYSSWDMSDIQVYPMPSELCGDVAISDEGNVAAFDSLDAYRRLRLYDMRLIYATPEEQHILEFKRDEPLWEQNEYGNMQVSNLAWLDDHRLLFWGKLGCPPVPKVELYFSDNYEGINRDIPLEFPMHYVWRLFCYDINTQTYSPYLDGSGNMIDLVDKAFRTSNTIIVQPEYDLLLMICDDDNPLMGVDFEDDIWIYRGATELTALSLKDGKKEVIYRIGNESYNYEKLWEYMIKMHGTPIKEDEWVHPLTDEEMKDFEQCQEQIPITNEEPEGLYYRFYKMLPAVGYLYN